jgi:2'-5' RNA ligase superfamily
MRGCMKLLAAVGLGVATLLGNATSTTAQQDAVTAIDVALEPDATMIRHAKATNARLLGVYPHGFALDATHNPHVTLLQQFVPTADLDKVYAALDKALAGEHPTSWKLKAFKYYYIAMPPLGVAGIVIEPTDDLRRLQQKVIDAVAPFAARSGTAAAFASSEGGRDIQTALIDYVANFVAIGSGPKFNPHVTTGAAPEAYLKEMLAEPFEAFTFSPAATSIYQLGTFGTARKELKILGAKP